MYRRIVVDDFGYSSESNKLVIRAIESGVVTDVSTMVGMPGSNEAFRYIQHHAPGVSLTYGLHLNITEGFPVSKPVLVPSLLDENGCFLGWQGLTKRLCMGSASLKEVELEIENQLQKLASAAQPIAFINSHHHIHFWPSVAGIVSKLAKKNNITKIRAPRSVWLPTVLLPSGVKALVIQGMGVRSNVSDKQIRSTYFIDLDWAGGSSKKRQKLLYSAPSNSEVNCHPHIDKNGVSTVSDSTLAWLMSENSQ